MNQMHFQQKGIKSHLNSLAGEEKDFFLKCLMQHLSKVNAKAEVHDRHLTLNAVLSDTQFQYVLGLSEGLKLAIVYNRTSNSGCS